MMFFRGLSTFCQVFVLGCVAIFAEKALAIAEQKNVLVLIGDDFGIQSTPYGNPVSKTPNLEALAKRSVLFKNGYTSVSSCSPSRSTILTGLPQHENGMYGLHHSVHHFQSFDGVQSLPIILNKTGNIRTGIIGKKHVGPDYVYPFDYSKTEENGYSLNQVGRNITFIKELAREFLEMYSKGPFLLYIGFFDTHRAGGADIQKHGQFCENFGDGSPGMGVIPDWKPITYDPSDVVVPPYLPDTPATRADLAAMYKSISRLDQGVGLLLKALEDYNVLNNTLIISSADNGIPFPNAKTNLYEPGMVEPFMVSSPYSKSRWGDKSSALVGNTDIVPTVLDWFGLPYPKYKLNGMEVTPQGKSLLPLLDKEPSTGWDEVYSSHNLHEVTMYYPMRVVRTNQYRLLHNLNFKMPYPIASDLFGSPTYQDILNRSTMGQETKWFKTLHTYYYRDEWELYDLESDPNELTNLASDPNHASTLNSMKDKLLDWQAKTNDPWLCAPEGVLEGGQKCQSMHNEL